MAKISRWAARARMGAQDRGTKHAGETKAKMRHSFKSSAEHVLVPSNSDLSWGAALAREGQTH
eukprot:2321837-Rhodomonas_salina.1